MFWLTATTVAASIAAIPVQQQNITAITNVRIIDGNGGNPIPHGVVIFQDDQITAVGPSDEISVPAGAKVIDGAGKTALPGLADFHTHLVGGWDGDRVDILGYRRYLNSLLYSGVTAVFDAGNVLPYVQQMHQEIEQGRLTGPRIFFAGPLIEGADPVWPAISYAVSSVAQLPGYVGQLKAAGVHAIKAYGGLSLMQLGALVRAAQRDSLDVIVDAWGANGSADVARTGVRAFAHVSGRDMTDETITVMVEKGVANITTLTVVESFSRRRLQDLGFLSGDLIAHTTPSWMLQELTDEAMRPLTQADTAVMERSCVALEAGKRNVKRLFDAGVLLVAGTDAPYPGVFFGEGIHREVELLVEAGLTPLQALTAATKNAAILMDVAEEWGTLEPGRRADILIVAGNPAETIGDTRQVEIVVQGGRVVDRRALQFDPASDPGFRTGVKVSGG
jgi:imidazolonepropionase-like amidohydrolase